MTTTDITTVPPGRPPIPPPRASPHDQAQDAIGTEPSRQVTSFFIYPAAVRIWHWAIALIIPVLAVTGYYLGSPPHSVAGDTSKLFVMGHLREWHFIAGWLMIIGILWRTYWAIVGDKHARLIYYVPFWRLSWWKELYGVVLYYLFIDRKPHKWVGHNPLAQASMFGMFTLGSIFMIFSGLAMYGEQMGLNSWESRWFGWMIGLFGSSMTLRTWHHDGMYVLLLYTIIHVYFCIRDDVMGRVSTISSMVNGWRTFRDTED